MDEGHGLRASVACLFDDDRDGIVDVQIHIDGVPAIKDSGKQQRSRGDDQARRALLAARTHLIHAHAA